MPTKITDDENAHEGRGVKVLLAGSDALVLYLPSAHSVVVLDDTWAAQVASPRRTVRIEHHNNDRELVYELPTMGHLMSLLEPFVVVNSEGGQ